MDKLDKSYIWHITTLAKLKLRLKECRKGWERMSEQDRLNANDYHFSRYEEIYNAKDLAEAKAIALQEMKIISDDLYIENDEEGKIIELPSTN